MCFHTIADVHSGNAFRSQPFQIQGYTLSPSESGKVILIDVEMTEVQADFQARADSLDQVFELRKRSTQLTTTSMSLPSAP